MMIQHIATRLAEEAGFLWLLRTNAVRAPHFDLDDLAALDERLEAQVDGLRVAADAGWEFCKSTLQSSEPEWLFAATLLAHENGKESRLQDVMEAVGEDRARARPVISALGWLEFHQCEATIRALLAADSVTARYIAIAASAIHRHDLGIILDHAAFDPCALVRARTLRAYGELGRCRESHLKVLKQNLTAEDDELRFAAAWSAALVGDAEAVAVLKDFVRPVSDFREKALHATLRRMELSQALYWQEDLADNPETVRQAVVGAGIIGDCSLIPWLLDQMAFAPRARLAGEAFTQITGVDFTEKGMKARRPEGFNAGPNDDPADPDVAMDPDADLPWPDRELITAWWHGNKGSYRSGIRYLLGQPISEDHLRRVLRSGRLRHRAAAALELAMMHPGQPLAELRAPGYRQKGRGGKP